VKAALSRLAFCLWAVLPVLAPRVAVGEPGAFQHRVDLRLIGLLERSRPGPFGSVFNEDLDDDILGIYAAYGVAWQAHRRVQLQGLLDTNVINLRDGELLAGPLPFEEELEQTGFLREAWLTLDLPAGLDLGAGKRRVRMADGLIFDEYATGAELAVQAGPLRWSAGGWWPGRALVPPNDPILGTTLTWQIDLSNTLYLFAYGDAPDASDGAAFVKDLVSALLPELPTVADCATLRGNSLRYWLGGGLNLLFEGHSIRAAGAWQLGHAAILPASIDAPDCAAFVRSIIEALPRVDEPIAAFGLDAAWRARISSHFFAGVFGTWLSGDPEPLSGTWTAFSTPAPLLPNSLLFFNGNTTSTILDNTLSLSGVEGRGVRAAGLTALFVANARLEVDVLLAGLWPDAGSGAYGTEYNARLRARLSDAIDLRIEFGALLEGAVYDAPRTWWQSNVALNWQWDSTAARP
jgi:hypothetical protein